MRLAEFYQYCSNYYREYGLRRSISSFCNLVLKPIKGAVQHKKVIFFETNIEDAVSNFKKDISMNLVSMKKEDIENLNAYNDGWFNRYKALKRLQDGCVLLTLLDNSKMIFINWLEFKKIDIPFIDLSICIPNDTVYLAFSYIDPEYRGRGIASKEKQIITKYLQECGYKKAFLVIQPENIASQKVNKKGGAKEYQVVTYRRFLFLKYYCVVDYVSGQKEIFWRIRRIDNNIWRVFSKLQTM